MKVRELIEQLQQVEDQDAIVCVPDFSLCSCGARDGEYAAQTITIKREGRIHPWVVIE